MKSQLTRLQSAEEMLVTRMCQLLNPWIKKYKDFLAYVFIECAIPGREVRDK